MRINHLNNGCFPRAMGLRDFIKREGIVAGGLTALVALETPVHETIHCGTAKVLPSVACEGITLSAQNHWYAKPLEWATFGWFKAGQTPAGVDGYAALQSIDSTMGHLTTAATAAAPNYLYAAAAVGLITAGVKNHKTNPIRGMMQAVAGLLLVPGTHYYMSTTLGATGRGNDYGMITSHLVQAVHMPAPIAEVVGRYGASLSALAIFMAAYFTAGILTRDD
jgi:hypothetical protein